MQGVLALAGSHPHPYAVRYQVARLGKAPRLLSSQKDSNAGCASYSMWLKLLV